MKLKQVAAIMLISASTAVGSMWAYNRISQHDTYVYQSQLPGASTKTPSNYAKFDGVTGVNNERQILQRQPVQPFLQPCTLKPKQTQ